MDLRRIAGLFNEKPWEYGPISRICSRFMSKSDRLLAIIRPQSTVYSGQIAAVQVVDLFHEATLEIFRRKKGRIELHSADTAYSPLIFLNEERAKVTIVGRLVGVIRRN